VRQSRCARRFVALRRGFLFKLGLALNVLGAALVGVPVLGYILAPARRLGGGTTWIKLGVMTRFPEGETRLAIYENPFRVPWDGHRPRLPAGCGACRATASRFSPSIARTLDAPCAGFPSRSSSCAPATAASTTRTDRAHRARARGLYEYEYQIREGQLWVRGGQLPTLAGQV